jgi:hypothetical protein
MASNSTGIASGADFDTQATRRRNVPSTPSGELVNRIEIDEKKTQVKHVSSDRISLLDQKSLNGITNKYSSRANKHSYKCSMNGSSS